MKKSKLEKIIKEVISEQTGSATGSQATGSQATGSQATGSAPTGSAVGAMGSISYKPRKKIKSRPKKTKSRVNEAGNYTKPAMRKRLFNSIKASNKGGAPGQWSARKAQMLARRYKAAGGGYK